MSEKMTGRESDKFMLRLPDGMRERIKDAAAANGRSMNAEIVATLTAAYPPEPTIEDVIYWANDVANDFLDAPDYFKLRNLRAALSEVREQLERGRREGYPRPGAEVLAEQERARDADG